MNGDLTDVTNSILTCHALSGCETVAKLSGIGKTTALNILKKGQHHLDNFSNSSSTTTDHADLVQQSTGLFTSCYGVKDNISHYYVGSSFPGLVIKGEKKESNLCTITTVHSTNYNYSVSLSHNVKGAFFQTSHTQLTHQHYYDPLKYGWTRDEQTKTLLPVQLPLLGTTMCNIEMQMCSCSSSLLCSVSVNLQSATVIGQHSTLKTWKPGRGNG